MQEDANRGYHFKELIIFAALVLLCYHHILHSPWQLDDKPGITENQLLHLTNLSPSSLLQTFIAKPFAPGDLYRPIANLSFGINWLWGADKTFGYHLVNCIIHIINTFLLFKASLIIVNQSSRTKAKTPSHAYSIALLSAVLWCVNPVQTQAVTYIIQRMASMGTMFFLLSLLSYLHFRLTPVKREKLLFCILFFILALGCKENTITLIPTLLLVEFFFFHKADNKSSISIFSILLCACILFVIAGFIYLISHGYFIHFFETTGSRPFSPFERLITQPRVLLFYLSLIFFPTPDRLSIDHGIEHSASLLAPLTTLPAILAILSIVFIALYMKRRFQLFSFAVLFFFINHLIESTIIPLEMVFEHRNYLPSLFLFLPLSALFIFLLEHFQHTSKIIVFSGFLLGSFVIFSYALSTYTRNLAWQSEERLWLSALANAPNNARPLSKLGNIYGWEKGFSPQNYAKALAFYNKSLVSYSPRTSFKASVYDNIGKLHRRYGNLDLAIDYYQIAHKENSRFQNSLYEISEIYVLQGKYEKALHLINELIAADPRPSRYFKVKTLSLLRLGRNREAAIAGVNTMRRSAVKQNYFHLTGVGLLRSGNFKQAEWFIDQALLDQPKDIRIMLSSLELSILAGDMKSTESLAARIVGNIPIKHLEKTIHTLQNDSGSIPIDFDLIKPVLEQAVALSVNHFGV